MNMVQFQTIINFRDVGATINDQVKSKWLKTGLLYRSARPDECSLAERALLKDTLGIKTIVDLRTTTEHDQQAQKRKQRLRSVADKGEPPNEANQRPAQIEGIEYRLINFNGHAYSRHLISQLSWSQFFSLLYLMAIGRRLEAISILGENVMRPRGLSGLAVDSVDVCTAEVKAVFQLLADEQNYPVLLHCTQGKDRTGLTVLLTLMLLGTDSKAIDADYMMSRGELLPEKEAKLAEVHSIGLTDEFADCDPGLVATVINHILEKHQSVEAYLQSCGVTGDTQQDVKRILIGEEHPSCTKG